MVRVEVVWGQCSKECWDCEGMRNLGSWGEGH